MLNYSVAELRIKKSVHIDRIVLTDYDDYLTVRQAMNGKTSY